MGGLSELLNALLGGVVIAIVVGWAVCCAAMVAAEMWEEDE